MQSYRGNGAISQDAYQWWSTHVARTHLRSGAGTPGTPNKLSSPRMPAGGLSPRLMRSPRGPGPLTARLNIGAATSAVLSDSYPPFKDGAILPPRPGDLRRIMTPQLLDPLLKKSAVSGHGTVRDMQLKCQDMYRAFKFLDLDCNGKLSAEDIDRGLASFNFPINFKEPRPRAALSAIVDDCIDKNGGVDYVAFIKAFNNDEVIGTRAQAKMVDEPTPPPLRKGVAPDEVRKAQRLIKDRILDKYSGFKHAFESVDDDNSGFINRKEIEVMFKKLEIPAIRPEVMDTLIDIIDCEDNSGGGEAGEADIHYREFARAFATDDIMGMRPLPAPKPPSTPQVKLSAADQLAGFVRTKFHPEQMKQAFTFLDTDKSGALSRREIKRAMAMWNIVLTNKDLDDIFEKCDDNGDGNISYNEFLNVSKRMPELLKTRTLIKERPLPQGVTAEMVREGHRLMKEKIFNRFKLCQRAFEVIDEDRNGVTTKQEFMAFLKNMNLDIPEAVLKTIANFANIDRETGMNYSEFTRLIFIDDIMRLAPINAYEPKVLAPQTI